MEKRKNIDENKEFDLDVLGFGGLFKGIEKLVDLAGKLQDEKVMSKEGEINLDHIKQGMKAVYGFTIKSAAGGGTPTVETFGNIKKTPEGPMVEEEREPMTDIFDENDEIVVIAEMPGIEESDIKIDRKGDMLEISAERNTRKYRKELLLPNKIDGADMKKKYNNGILEIRFRK